MLSEREVLVRVARLDESRLRVWVSRGWVKPAAISEPVAFSDADVARISLICDLEDELGFDEESVPVLLNLIDQIHGLRRELARMHGILGSLPEPLLDELRTSLDRGERRSG